MDDKGEIWIIKNSMGTIGEKKYISDYMLKEAVLLIKIQHILQTSKNEEKNNLLISELFYYY